MKNSFKELGFLVLSIFSVGLQSPSTASATSCDPAPSGIVAWWPAEGNANDIIGTNNALLEGGVGFAPGEVGQAFVFDGTNGYVLAPASSSLDVGLGTGFTIEGWILPQNLSTQQIIAGWHNTGNYWGLGTHLQTGTGSQGGASAGALFGNIVDTSGNYHWLWSDTNVLVTGQFQHVALTYDKNSGMSALYVNGSVVAQTNLGIFTPQTSYDFYLGERPGWSLNYSGLLDEISVYNRSLSSNEIAGIYDAGSAGKCFTATPPTASLFFDDFTGPTLNPMWTTNLPPAYCGSYPNGYTTPALYVGAPNYGFQTVGGYSVIRLTNTLGQLQRCGWGSASNFVAGNFRYDARYNTLVQSPTTSIDGFIEIWIIDATNSSRYDIISPFGGSYSAAPYFFVGSTIDGSFTQTPISYGSNTWYHLVLQCAPGQNLRASILNDDGTELVGQNLAHGAEAYGSGFRIALSQVIGGAGSPYPVDVAVDYVNLTTGSALSPPHITSQPTNETVAVGGTASFSVAASGSAPLSFQWNFNNTNIVGATNATLGLTNIQLNQAGNYQVTVSNAAGSTNSAVAVLTVTPAPATCDPVPSGIVAWWPAEGNANDIIGTNNGALEGGLGFAPGKVSQAFFFNATNEDVKIPTSQSLNVGTGNGFTLEAWVSCSNVTSLNPIYEWNLGDGNTQWGVHFYVGAGGPGTLYANVVDSSGGWHSLSSSQNIVAAGVFQHVALTYDKTTGMAVIYLNGAIVAQSTLGSYTPQTSYNLYLGRRPGPEANYTFAGLIDEASIYNRGLSSNEIATIYEAGSAGKCFTPAPPVITSQPTNQTVAVGGMVVFNTTATGTPPLYYQWSFNGANIPGATSSSLVLTNVQYDQVGNYQVTVSNVFGVAISSNAVLSLSSPLASSFFDDFSGTNLNPIWQTNLPNNAHSGSFPGYSQTATYMGSPNFGFQTLNGYSVLRLTNSLAPLNRCGWGSSTNFGGTNFYYEARFNTLNQSPSTSIDGFIELWIMDAANSNRYDIISPFGGDYDAGTYFFAGSSIDNYYVNPSFTYSNYTWYRLVLQCAPGQNIRGSVLNDAGTELVGVTFSHTAAAFPSGFKIGISQSVGSAGATYPVDVAVDYLYLTTTSAPFITAQPTNETATVGGTATFSVIATGMAPLGYQWSFNGTNINGATNATLTLMNVQLANVGNYAVAIANSFGVTNSATAALVVPETVLSLGSTNAMSGSTIVVPVWMNALGVENAVLASVGYDPTKLALQSVTGSNLTPVYTQTNNGYVGFAVVLNPGATFPPGNNQLAELVFTSLPVTNHATVNLTFGDTPTGRQVVDNNFDSLPAAYVGGTVALSPSEYEADVYPRTNGDNQVNIFDWIEVGRMVAGLDVPTNSDEFARADCAPRNAPDGVLTVADWVQAGRYALGLDPLTLVPAASSHTSAEAKPQGGPIPSRILTVACVSAQRGQTVNVPVMLVCVTNENAMGVTIGYNTNLLRFVSATLGANATGGRLNVNTNRLGEAGVALALSPGAAFTPGTNQVVVLQFATSTSASGTASLTLDNTVVQLQVADNTANSLAAAYVNGAVALPNQPALGVAATGGKLQFNWPLAAGTFQVQTADQPLGPWMTIVLPLITNGANVTATCSPTNHQQFFRLQGQ